METNEFRLGNLINRKFWNPEPNKEMSCYDINFICFIDMNNINVKTLNRKEKFSIKKDEIVPIKLNTDWLVRFDFIKDDECFWCKNSINDDFKLTDKHSYDVDQFEFYYGINSSIRIEYVHQLQNLYYALTGKEL